MDAANGDRETYLPQSILSQERQMQQNTYLLIASCILGLVAAMHLVRVIRGQPLTIGSWKMPFGASLLWILVVTFPAQAQAPNESTVIYLSLIHI